MLNFIKKNIKYSKSTGNTVDAYDNFSERKRLMKFNRFFSQRKVYSTVYVVAAFLIFVLLVYLFNKLDTANVREFLATGVMTYDHKSWYASVADAWFIFAILIVAEIIGYFIFSYNVRVSYGDINIGQKGTARWADPDELREQYVFIPDCETETQKTFAGYGGIPVAREGRELAIDTSNVNNLIIGATRSGKGQMIVFPMIDILSRAEKQCSMIITDPKLELSNQTIPKLQERGYRCFVLNTIDPEYSMGFNPLKTVIDEFKDGEKESAQQLCASLGFNIFAPQPGEKDPYFTDQARNVFIALVMAEIEDNINADVELNERYRRLHDKEEEEREVNYYKNLYGKEYNDYIMYSISKEIISVNGDIEDYDLICEIAEEMQYFSLPKKYSDNINKLKRKYVNDRQADELKKAVDEIIHFNVKNSSFVKRPFYETHENEDKITIYSIIKLCNTLSSNPGKKEGWTALDDYFDNRDESSFPRITYGAIITASEATKGTIMSVFRGRLTLFSQENIAKMTAKSSLNFLDIGFGKEPVAIFIGLPDYDKSNYFIATILINQIYFVLSKYATAMPNGELRRRVHFLLDEFGNMPAIDNLSNIVTVCLGRQMMFTFIIQAFSQMKKLYEEDTDTIIGNCGNKIYIMTSDQETANAVSEELGKETIITVNRTGKKLSINKEQTEMTDEQPLLTAEQLKKLELGENIVLRYMKREGNNTKFNYDEDGNLISVDWDYIKQTPIANMGKRRFKYSFEFLPYFPKGQQLYESPNLAKIRSANPEIDDIKVNIIDVGLDMTTDIKLERCSRSVKEYLEYKKWRAENFPVANVKEQALDRKNKIFRLLSLSAEDQKRYELADAGSEDADVNPITYGSLVDYAYKCIEGTDKPIRDKGYEILETVCPLPKKSVTLAEEKAEQENEREMLNLINQAYMNKI